MASRFRTQYLVLASSVAVALIVCSYLFSGPYSFRPSVADAATAESLLKAYSTKDSDSDGLPDWQESLYGTDPANPQSYQTGIRDGDAVAQGLIKPRFESAEASSTVSVPGVDAGADTLTTQFARMFFTQYVQKYGAQKLSDAQLQQFTSDMIDSLAKSTARSSTYSAKDITVSGTGAQAFRAYVIGAEDAFKAHTIATEKDELSYMSDAIEKNDASALPQVRAIGKAYAAIAKAYVKVPAPKEAQEAHLAVANAMVEVSDAILNMATIETDPIRALVGLAQYPQAAHNLAVSFTELNAVFVSLGITMNEGDAGYSIYKAATKSAAASAQ